MTPEERKKRRELIEHCKMKRDESGFDLVIFARHIVKRSDIPNIKTQISNPDYVSQYDPDYVPPKTPHKRSPTPEWARNVIQISENLLKNFAPHLNPNSPSGK